jgi:hypothetical protein
LYVHSENSYLCDEERREREGKIGEGKIGEGKIGER